MNKTKRTQKLIMYVVLYLLPIHVLAAKITVSVPGENASCWGSVHFDGEIVDGDAARLEKELLKLHKKFHTPIHPKQCYGARLWLHLRSPGGYLLEGIALGRLARKYELQTIAHDCASSCVMVFAGGVRRLALGQVEVHQPFFRKIDPKLTSRQIESIRNDLIEKKADYLIEMNVSTRLLDISKSTKPDKMRALTKRELLDLRLEGVDSDFEEREISQEAYIYGVDSAQLRRGKVLAKRRCKHASPDFFACQTAAILQISLEQARRIKDRAERCLPEREKLLEKEFIECLRSAYDRKSPTETLSFIPFKPRAS